MDQGAHLQQCFENWFKTLNVQKEILKSTAMDINGRNKDKIIKDNNSANQDFLRAQPVIPSYYILKRCFY
jgi:hypothetical protein